MATDKPRFTITMDEDTLDLVDAYKYKNKINTQSKAIIRLVRKGLEEISEKSGSKKASAMLSEEALRVARDYSSLDRWGKQTVRSVLDDEHARCEDEARFLKETEEPKEPKVITLYSEPSAAGIASPVEGKDYCFIELGPDDPHGAAYAVQLQGDSMEPDFPDGSIVFVNHDAVEDGDIGIFSVDGGAVCKQYHKDALGMVYLFSLNRKRKDADIVIPPNSNQTLVCQGRVITKRRYPLPGR